MQFGLRNELHPWIQKAKHPPLPDPANNIPSQCGTSRTDYKHLIKRTLVSRTEDLVRRMRWKLWHIRNPSNKDPKETFGFRTTDSPPVMVELEDFEKDLWNLVRQVKFKPAGNDLTSKIREDLNTLKNSSKIILKSFEGFYRMGEELCPDIPGGRGHYNALSKIIFIL